jgi:hypothetical protein
VGRANPCVSRDFFVAKAAAAELGSQSIKRPMNRADATAEVRLHSFAPCLSIGFAVLFAASAAARSEMIAAMFMSHNGSTIQEFTDGDRIEYRYSSVRAGVPAKAGDVLFRGTKHHEASGDFGLRGTAFTFKHGCPPAGYEVHGEQTRARITLSGPAPRRATHSCAIVGYDPNSGNAKLVFDIAE